MNMKRAIRRLVGRIISRRSHYLLVTDLESNDIRASGGTKLEELTRDNLSDMMKNHRAEISAEKEFDLTARVEGRVLNCYAYVIKNRDDVIVGYTNFLTDQCFSDKWTGLDTEIDSDTAFLCDCYIFMEFRSNLYGKDSAILCFDEIRKLNKKYASVLTEQRNSKAAGVLGSCGFNVVYSGHTYMFFGAFRHMKRVNAKTG